MKFLLFLSMLFIGCSGAIPATENAKCLCTPYQSVLFVSNLTSLSEINHVFGIQYSYDKPPLDPAYISTSQAGVSLTIYPSDKSHAISSDTFPRTELLYRKYLPEEVPYTYQIDQYISVYNQSYQFCFMQLFGATGPNILIRWRNGAYEIVTRNGNIRASSAIVPRIRTWTTWKVSFLLSSNTTKGYVQVYRDKQLVMEFRGASSVGGSFRPKFGIYGQGMLPPSPTTMIYRNMFLAT